MVLIAFYWFSIDFYSFRIGFLLIFIVFALVFYWFSMGLYWFLMQEFPAMDKRWCCFGEVLTGMEIVSQMEDVSGFHVSVVPRRPRRC